METTDIQNDFPETNIVVTIFFISIKIGFYAICVVAMDTKFNFVLQNSTFLCFNLYSSIWYFFNCFFSIYGMENGSSLQIATKWHTLCHLVSPPLKGTLCHLVSCGGTQWQNDTKCYTT